MKRISLAGLIFLIWPLSLCLASNDGWQAGNDFYRQRQYDEAIKSYEGSLTSANKATEAALNYNIGNCKFRQGRMKESSDLAGAIADYRSSLDYYKRAMELAPHDKDARFNHEFVEKLLKSLMDKLKKQKEQRQESKSGQDNKEEQKDQQTKSGEQKSSQSGQAQQTKTDEQKEGLTGATAQGHKQQYEAGGQLMQQGPEPFAALRSGAGKEQQGQMSSQEARMLLDDYRQKEQQDRQIADKHAPSPDSNVEKDW